MFRTLLPVTMITFGAISGAVIEQVRGDDDLSRRVTVQVLSGRVFVADIDGRTDEQTLWLRYGTSNTTLLRPIRWQYVVRCEQKGKTVDRTSLIRLANRRDRTSEGRVFERTGSEQPTVREAAAPSDAERARRALGLFTAEN